MAKWGSCDFQEMEALRDKMDALGKGKGLDRFCEACAKELAARLLSKVIKRTPVRRPENCPPGVTGGTLRRGWTGGTDTNAAQYASSLKIVHAGSTYTVVITNPVEYAMYVEYGHRTRGGKHFVDGVFMMTDSEKELSAAAPGILQKKLEAYLKGVFAQ